jgi:electron transfer flavoprotein alpha subunit
VTRRSERRARRNAGVLRRDPRRERETVAPGPLAPAPEPISAGDIELRRVVIEDPQSWVIAVPDLDRGRLTTLDRDLIGAARLLADAQGGAVLVAVAAGCLDDLGAAGADRVVRFAALATGAYAPATLARALVELARSDQAKHLLFADTPTAGGDVGRRIAALLGERPAAHVKALNPGEVFCLADGGRKEIVRSAPRVILVEAGCAEPVAGHRHEGRELTAPELGFDRAITDLGAVKVDRSAVPLVEAELILSAGGGVSDWASFHRLAAQLGAAEGASRVACDLGYLPRDRQVGASGSVVEPRGYIALGISGAPQHLQGIARCERVVAVNSDRHAPMIQRADLAIVADVQQLMPALADLAQRERRRD